jgi:hypothetical protein
MSASRTTLPMTDPTPTDRIIAQGKALVRAIEALGFSELWLSYRNRRI